LGRRPHPQYLSPGAISPAQESAGPKKAILAVAASILTAAYHILKDDVTYRELGSNYTFRFSLEEAETPHTQQPERNVRGAPAVRLRLAVGLRHVNSQS
jgi:hypothetical protein